MAFWACSCNNGRMDGWMDGQQLCLTVWFYFSLFHFKSDNVPLCLTVWLLVCFKMRLFLLLNYFNLTVSVLFFTLRRKQASIKLLVILFLYLYQQSLLAVVKCLTGRWVGSTLLLSGAFMIQKMYIMLQITHVVWLIGSQNIWTQLSTLVIRSTKTGPATVSKYHGITVPSYIITEQQQYCIIMFNRFVQ